MYKITEDKTYSVREIAAKKLIPGIKDYRSYLKRIMEDAAKGTKSILKPQILGEGYAKRIYVKGANLIKYLESLKK